MELYQGIKKMFRLWTSTFQLYQISLLFEKTKQNRFQILSSLTSVKRTQSPTRALHIWATVCINISVNAALNLSFKKTNGVE